MDEEEHSCDDVDDQEPVEKVQQWADDTFWPSLQSPGGINSTSYIYHGDANVADLDDDSGNDNDDDEDDDNAMAGVLFRGSGLCPLTGGS